MIAHNTTTRRHGALDGQRTLVIGGGSGIGRAVVDAYLREGARTAVLELAPDKCAAIQSARPDVSVYQGDAASLLDVQKIVNDTVHTFGGLDVLVNCVGLFDYYAGIQSIDDTVFDSAFDEAFTTNVKSQLTAVKAAIPSLAASQGSIILTTSTSSFYAGRGGVLYVAAKFAVRGAVIALAHELAPAVRVNSVAPGGTVDTDLRGLRSLGMEGRSLGRTPGRAADLRARTPLEVALSSQDHAGSYVFLATPAARGMTGCFLHPDGGIGIQS